MSSANVNITLKFIMDMQVREDPIKEIVIHRLQKRTLDEFAHIHCSGHDQVIPIWCGGYVIALYSFMDNDQTVALSLNGHRHYDEISYAECPKYVKRLSLDGKELETPIFNFGNDDLAKALVDYIKSKGKIPDICVQCNHKTHMGYCGLRCAECILKKASNLT